MNVKRQEANRVRVNRFRERAKGQGCKRLDIRLSGEAYVVLLGYRAGQEHLGETLSRLLVSLSGNEQERVTGHGRTDGQSITGNGQIIVTGNEKEGDRTVTGNGEAIVTGNGEEGDRTVTGNGEAIVTGNGKEGDRTATGNGQIVVTGNEKEGDRTVTGNGQTIVTGNGEEGNQSVTGNERIAITGNAKATLRRRLQAMKTAGLSYQGIAERLNAEGVPTLSGRGQWRKGSVGNLLRSG